MIRAATIPVCLGIVLCGMSGGIVCKRTFDYARASTLRLPIKGMSLESGDSPRWSINVGILNDRDGLLLERRPVRRLLKKLRNGSQERYPGLALRFIIDQPLDAQFIMPRILKGSRDGPNSADHPLLRLGVGKSSRRENMNVMRRFGFKRNFARIILHELQMLQSHGTIRLYDKDPVRMSVWRKFARSQIRYDIIIINALLIEDRLTILKKSAASNMRNWSGIRKMAIFKAPGRQGMEGWAALVSFHPGIRSTRIARDAEDQRLIRLLGGALDRLIVPDPSTKKPSTYWRGRLLYLGGAALLHSGKPQKGCRRMQKGLGLMSARTSNPAKSSDDKEQQSMLRKSKKAFMKFCRMRRYLLKKG